MTTRTRTLSLAMICLMVFSTTLVHAATISTFANGNSDVDVELRDQGTWGDDLTAGISMPAGETVNAAGFIVGTDYAEHNDVQIIDSSLVANGEIWNPIYNGGMTQYSSSGDFTVAEEYLQLTSQGYNADFESGSEGWTTGPDQGIPPLVANWARGNTNDNVLPTLGCGVGDWCWGTDFENPDYTANIPDGEFEMTLTSVSFFVHPGKADMTFRSYHSLFYREAGTNQYYYDDCAMLQCRTQQTMLISKIQYSPHLTLEQPPGYHLVMVCINWGPQPIKFHQGNVETTSTMDHRLAIMSLLEMELRLLTARPGGPTSGLILHHIKGDTSNSLSSMK